jgi:DNA uptake protein ComE-like DNA-binding protein
MSFKKWREAFVFSNKERNGLLVLVFFLLIIIAADYFLPVIFPPKMEEVTVTPIEIPRQNLSRKPADVALDNPMIVKDFNPNTTNESSLLKMGLPAKLAANWGKYLQKGGSFRKKEDVRKLFGMTEDIYSKIEPFLQIVPTLAKKKEYLPDSAKKYKARLQGQVFYRNKLAEKKSEVVPARPSLELNRADSAQLDDLPGIGPTLASRIIRYKNLLGGYCKVQQLMEIYGMKEEYFSKASAFLITDSSLIMKLNINFASFAELGRHPYIGFKQAKKVLKRRDSTGKFSDIADLSPIFTPDSLRKLTPYLNLGSGVP